MDPIPLKLRFRGTRGYVHGTDLYSATHAAFAEHFGQPSFTDIRMRISRFYLGALKLVIGTDLPEPDWQCLVDGVEWGARWEDWIDGPSLPREPFDEPAFRHCVRVTETDAQLVSDPRCTPIDCAVFLAKTLHQERFSEGAARFWALSRLELSASLQASDVASMSVSFERQLGDFFTRSALSGAGRRLGTIYFSLVEKRGGAG